MLPQFTRWSNASGRPAWAPEHWWASHQCHPTALGVILVGVGLAKASRIL
jgi:hypothetical protein